MPIDKIFDKIIIQQLALETVIGILPHELTQVQTLLLDIEIAYQNSAHLTDSIDDALSYAQVVADLEQLAKTHQTRLLEAFAEQICRHILCYRGVQNVTVKMIKPSIIPQTQGVGIQVFRSKE